MGKCVNLKTHLRIYTFT